MRAVKSENESSRSEQLCQLLVEEIIRIPECRVIAIYSALTGEPDLVPLMAMLPNKIFAFPRVEGENMSFHIIGDASDLSLGAWGIAEPAAHAPLCHDIDLMLCPGLAFTKDGTRLGKGAGYYDRYLFSLAKNPLLWGIQFTERIIAAIPSEAHDVRMDRVFHA